AAKSAANYLKFSSFSRKGLIDQLKFEGFSAAEAEYGVNTTGL
ncbi:Ltp family lipoprotein, partial [Gemmatimonas sp.]